MNDLYIILMPATILIVFFMTIVNGFMFEAQMKIWINYLFVWNLCTTLLYWLNLNKKFLIGLKLFFEKCIFGYHPLHVCYSYNINKGRNELILHSSSSLNLLIIIIYDCYVANDGVLWCFIRTQGSFNIFIANWFSWRWNIVHKILTSVNVVDENRMYCRQPPI